MIRLLSTIRGGSEPEMEVDQRWLRAGVRERKVGRRDGSGVCEVFHRFDARVRAIEDRPVYLELFEVLVREEDVSDSAKDSSCREKK
jgi:hypothetical protein